MAECILAGRRGEQGETGAQGLTGERGPTGPAGPNNLFITSTQPQSGSSNIGPYYPLTAGGYKVTILGYNESSQLINFYLYARM